KNQFGNGPRSTPALDGGFVYVTSVTGPLLCLDAASGKEIWRHDLLKDFGGENITWGLSASPRIDGDLVLVLPGGKGAGVAAYHKRSGQLAWKATDDKAAYATPAALTVGGKRQVVFFNAPGLLGVAADSGKELWRVPWVTEYDVNICTPLVVGDKVFVASGEAVRPALFHPS